MFLEILIQIVQAVPTYLVDRSIRITTNVAVALPLRVITPERLPPSEWGTLSVLLPLEPSDNQPRRLYL